jgi:hypothetical protein
MGKMYGGTQIERGSPLPGIDRSIRVAGAIALAWSVVLLAWAAYSCLIQVGIGTYALGILYYGSTDGTANADTGSLAYGVLYACLGVLILRGTVPARGVALGLAALDGYNRLRSLTGALFDPAQRRWYTGSAEGSLHLATLAFGLLSTVAMAILLVRRLSPGAPPWSPEPAAAPTGRPVAGHPQGFGPSSYGETQPAPVPAPALSAPAPNAPADATLQLRRNDHI